MAIYVDGWGKRQVRRLRHHRAGKGSVSILNMVAQIQGRPCAWRDAARNFVAWRPE